MISGKVINKDIDENGNIRVTTEYTLTDGSKTTGSVRYNFLNFSSLLVQKDIKDHCENLMRKVYGLKKHQEMLVATDLSNVKYDCESAQITKAAIKDKDGTIIQPQEIITIDDK